MYKKLSLMRWHSLGLGVLLLSSTSVYADISGKVFRDFNANGTQDATATFKEPGVGGITVSCADSAGGTGSTTTSTAAATLGTYTLTGCTGAARVEFSGLEQGDYSGPQGSGSKTNVQFLDAQGSGVNYGINYAKDYLSSSTPKVALPIYVGGSNSAGSFSGESVFVSFPWDNAGTTTPSKDATNAQIGSVWGTAYQRSSKLMFASAFLKRHADFGSGGLGGIYKVDYSGGSASASLFMNLTDAPYSLNLGSFDVTDGTRQLSTSNPTSLDTAAFAQVGKVGLGGLAISDDEADLYTVNLAQKKLVKIHVGLPAVKPVASDVSEFALPTPSCVKGEARPFAVEFYRGLVHVGITCTAENGGEKADLSAYLYTFNPATNTFSGVLPGFPIVLNYPKGGAHGTSSPKGDAWNPWSDNPDVHSKSGDGYYVRYPQPMLSDIGFTPSGLMVLAIMDRASHQWGYWNKHPVAGNLLANNSGGDMLLMWKNGSNWQLESNGVAGSVTGCGAGNNQGPGGGEFFCNDKWSVDHEETASGTAAVHSGRNAIKVAVMDPITYDTGGTSDWSLTNGAESLDYELFKSESPYITFGKAGGLGDIEILDAPAPVEVGNRVWLDTNGDGIQDAGEAGIDGVDVTLVCASGTATIKTANGGEYFFSNATGGKATFMKMGESCTVQVDGSQALLDGYSLTAQNADGVTDNNSATDLRDSDAADNAGKAEITFTVGNAGENNHTLDIGYKSAPVVTTDVSLVKVADKSEAKRGDTVVYTLRAANAGPDTATGVAVTDQLPAGVTWVSDDSSGAYDKTTGVWTVGELLKEDSKVLHITVTVN